MNLHETAMGQRFFNVQLPALINTLKDIAAALSRPAPSAISFPADQHFLTSLYYGEYEADVFKPDKRLAPFNQAVQQKEKALLPLLSNEASIAFEQYQAAVQCRNSTVLEQAYASGYPWRMPMERDELRTTLVNHLETLRRNLQVVSMEVLKTKYKKPFDVLRQDICKAATAYTRFLVFDGMRIKHKYFDEAVPYIDAAVKQTKRLKQISDAAFQRQDIDEIESLALALRKEIEAALQPFYMGHMCLYVTPECFDDPPKTPEIYNDATACVWRDGTWQLLEDTSKGFLLFVQSKSKEEAAA